MFDDIYPHLIHYSTGAAYKFPAKFYQEGIKPSAGVYDKLFQTELQRKMPPLAEEVGPLYDVTNKHFLSVEENNSHYNLSFPKRKSDRRFMKLIRLLRIEMLYLLGDSPKLDVPSQMTSGATTTCSTGNTPVHRWLDPEITDDLYDFILDHYIGIDYVFPVQSVTRNNFATGAHVPKTSSINRVILIPPVCNVTYERMLGTEISGRLRLRGIDITKAAELHKLLAYYGSMVPGLNTDDLANASNTISTELVRAILPPMWFSALNAARCKSYTLPYLNPVTKKVERSEHHMHMFMGNGCGFCFELETAIFAAIIKIAYGLAKIPTGHDYRDIHVYGDDLIYSSSATLQVRTILKACGFTIHTGKSFSDGYFRESCGGDYLNGIFVRPIHLKSRLETDRERVIFLNQITRQRRLNPASYTESVHMVYCEVLSSFEKQSNIFFGPEYLGDSVLQCPPFVDFIEPRVNRYGVSRIKIWTSTPVNVECFESFGYKLPFNALMMLASNGHLRDLGKRTVDLVISDRSLEGAPGYNKNGYPMVAKPGTSYEDIVQKTLYFRVSGLVDETDPVTSVFVLLSKRMRQSFPLCNSVIFTERRDECKRSAYRLNRERTLKVQTRSVRELEISFDSLAEII